MEYRIKEMPLEELEPKVIEGLLDHKERLGYRIPQVMLYILVLLL